MQNVFRLLKEKSPIDQNLCITFFSQKLLFVNIQNVWINTIEKEKHHDLFPFNLESISHLV